MKRELTEVEIGILLENQNVSSVYSNCIHFKDEFKTYFISQYLQGIGPTSIF